MARFLTPKSDTTALQQHVATTLQKWAASPCLDRPCGLDVWQYVNMVAGVEAEELPPHQTRRDMLKLLKAEGGLVDYAGKLVKSIGWTAVYDRPILGDVAVIPVKGMGLTCAVSMSKHWAVRGDRHVVCVLHNALTPSGLWRYC